MKKLSLFILLVFAVAASFAQTSFTATYTFTGSTGNVLSFAFNGTQPTGVTMGNIIKNNLTSSSKSGCFRAKGWPDSLDVNGGAIDLTKYIGFTMTANSGYKFTVTDITFGIGKSKTGTRCTQWRGSVDNFGAPFTNYSLGSTALSNNAGVIENPVGTDSYWNDNVLTLGANYQNITSCDLRMYMYHANGAGGTAGLQGPITITGTYQLASTDPILNVSTNSLTDFTYEENQGPSTAQIFSVSGANLTGNISISAPTNFELSLDGNTYSGSLSLTPSGGTVTSTDISVRLVAGLAVGSYSGTVQCTSPGATAQNVGLTGSVTAPPPPGYYVDFDGANEVKGSFLAGTLVLNGREWYLDDVVVPNAPLPNDWYEGVRSARMQATTSTAMMSMNDSKANGAGTISFDYCQYGTETQTSWIVEYTTNSYTDQTQIWTQVGVPFTPVTPYDTFSAVVNVSGNIRMRIRPNPDVTPSGRCRMNIDNIAITDYYDLSNGVPKVEGNNTITLTGGNANYSSTAPGDIPNAANFTASFHKRITLLGAGPWTINVAGPVGDWAACKQGSTWQAYEMTSGTASFTINAAKNADIELLMGNGNNPTLPVELSHFSATLTAQNYVQLAWVSQSETNVLGYYIYRNDKPELSSAAQICPLIHGTNTSGAQNYSYLDTDLYEEGTYYYWLQNVDMDGSSNYHGYVSVILRIEEEGGTPSMPTVTMLEDAYPNPFNPSTMIPYQIKEGGKVRIDIYNTRGQLVRSFEEKHETAGRYQINWNGRDSSGKELSSGVYLYKMSAKDYNSTKKIVLTK